MRQLCLLLSCYFDMSERILVSLYSIVLENSEPSLNMNFQRTVHDSGTESAIKMVLKVKKKQQKTPKCGWLRVFSRIANG